MTVSVERVVGVWRGGDGTVAEVIYGEAADPDGNAWRAVDALCAPREKIGTTLILSTRQRVELPTREIAYILPDRSGVLVLFGNSSINQEQTHADSSQSDNAAIFNADGTLRFRLKNPCGPNATFRRVESINRGDGSFQLGVRACPSTWPSCEQVYLVDGTSADIGSQVPLWMRD